MSIQTHRDTLKSTLLYGVRMQTQRCDSSKTLKDKKGCQNKIQENLDLASQVSQKFEREGSSRIVPLPS